jgi:hypothetical protein
MVALAVQVKDKPEDKFSRCPIIKLASEPKSAPAIHGSP